MAETEISITSRDIRGLVEAAGVQVDTIDYDGAGKYTVCFWANGWNDRAIMDAVNAQIRRRQAPYSVRYVPREGKPMERMVFRVVQK